MSGKYYGNEKYYLDAFERLDAVGKNTWNWSAFFFGPCWLAYRKMHAYSFLAFLFTYLSFWTAFIPFFFWIPFGGFPLILHILLGIFGNALYYRIVKKRVTQGYHLLENFKPTSIPCGLSCGALGVISFIADEFLRRKHFQTEEIEKTNQELSDFSLENIGSYLNEFRQKHIASRIADIIICLILITPSIIVPMTISHFSIKNFDKFMHTDNGGKTFYHHSHYYEKNGNKENYSEKIYTEKAIDEITGIDFSAHKVRRN
ncbi:MAG: DUF2628 domain-containing protein [Alphaproteobacteria bacterium]|nr:DUF2628 domain-containing protein [Alphaproteobacteria bacterium]